MRRVPHPDGVYAALQLGEALVAISDGIDSSHQLSLGITPATVGWYSLAIAGSR